MAAAAAMTTIPPLPSIKANLYKLLLTDMLRQATYFTRIPRTDRLHYSQTWSLTHIHREKIITCG